MMMSTNTKKHKHNFSFITKYAVACLVHFQSKQFQLLSYVEDAKLV